MRYRQERAREVLKSFLGEEISQIDDDRLDLVTITDVDVSKDLKLAKVFWSIPGDIVSDSANEQEQLLSHPSDARRAMVQEALCSYEKLLKKKIADRLEFRYTPQLVFKYDDTSVVGNRIDYLLKKVTSQTVG
jgi:ribosome-binding factor A